MGIILTSISAQQLERLSFGEFVALTSLHYIHTLVHSLGCVPNMCVDDRGESKAVLFGSEAL